MARENELVRTDEAGDPILRGEDDGLAADRHVNGKASGSAAKLPPAGTGKKRPKAKVARKTPAGADGPRWEAKSIPTSDLIVVKEDRQEPDPTDAKAQEKEKRFLGSIRAYGIVEPLVVRRDRKSRKYVVIAGRRRLRAARKLGLKEVPCRVLISECDDVQEAEISIIENAEREGLTPYEWALKFKALSEATGEKTAATKVYDVTKGTVSEYLLLLDEEVHKFLTPERFALLQRGQVSAKVVARNVRKLKDAQEEGTYEATLAAIKAAKPKAQQYKAFTYDDSGTHLSFQTKGQAEAAPTTQQVIDALGRWREKLEGELKTQDDQARPQPTT